MIKTILDLHAIMNLEEFGKAISNSIRVKLLSILPREGGISLDNCYEKVKISFPNIHRESVYRALEYLFDIELISKDYSHEKKRLLYSLISNSAKITFKTSKVSLIDE